MSRYVGLDVHKQFIEVRILDAPGHVAWRGRTGCLRDELGSFARTKLQKTDRVALEATTNTWSVVAVLQPHVAAVVASEPLKTRAIAEAKVKTDKVDAEVLAQLLRCDYLPAVWHPDERTQRRRRPGHPPDRPDDPTGAGQEPRAELARPAVAAAALQVPPDQGRADLAQGGEFTGPRAAGAGQRAAPAGGRRGEVGRIDAELVGVAQQEPRVRLLMMPPGVNYVVALGLLAALGDVSRFQDGDHAAARLGLAPSTGQSGRRCYQGPITKAGRSQARWLLTQSAQRATRHLGPLGAFSRRLAKRKNRSVAIAAVARKLVTVAFLMLKHNEPCRYACPELTREKFAALQARGSEPKGATPAAKPRAKGKPGPAEIHRAAGLPVVTCPEEPPKGEQRMLTERESTGFVAELYQPPAGVRPGRAADGWAREGVRHEAAGETAEVRLFFIPWRPGGGAVGPPAEEHGVRAMGLSE
jgi:transposase